MKLRPASRLIASCMLLLCVFAVPPLAFGAGAPVTVAQTLFSEGFEGALPQRAWLDYALPSPGTSAPAYWGKVSARKHAGSYGLWCAGTSTSSSTNGWTAFSGTYPVYTGALANFQVPELSEYYSATLDLFYTMPSLGTEDSGALNVLWRTIGGVQWDSHNELPVSAGWSRLNFNLTAPPIGSTARPIDLSRSAGEIRFNFIDSSGNVFESPATGEGPTIDDVAVAGFKYGPVRDLVATVASGQVTLNWMTPARSTVLLAPPEERPVAYRVWRSPDTQPYAWTEVTTDRVSGTSFTDPAPLDGSARYVVQAWDPGAGAGYGEVDLNAGARATVVPPVPVTTITGVTNGATYTEMPTITVSRDTVKGTTYYRWDATGSYVANPAQSFTVSPLEGTHTLEVYSTNTLGDAELPHKTLSLTLDLPTPPVAPVTAISVSGTTNSSGVYVTTPTITITRDQADGTTYYRWDATGAFTTTTAASFRLPATSGTHTLEAYSSVPGAEEAAVRTRTMTVTIAPVIKPPTRPSLSTPTISTSYPRRYRSFYIRGTVKPSHTGSTTVKLPLYRYYSGSYHFVKTYTVTLAKGATSYSLKLSLSKKSTYRVRAQHGCPVHISTYSSYKKFYVH